MTDRQPRISTHQDGEPIGALDRDHVDAVLERLRAHRAATPRLEVRGELGQGGMGLVLEVRDQDIRRALALKRPHPRRATDGDASRQRHHLARFLQEAQVTGQLTHPGIPPVHELSVDEEGLPYFTMPVIRGENLDQVIAHVHARRAGWTLGRALGVLLKVCDAMAFAHAKRVVHRDLKPSNVRIGRFGEVYVMDWGLARVLGRDEPDLVRWDPRPAASSVHTDRRESERAADEILQTLDGDILGTPFYMSPEQAGGELDLVGPRSDVYSVGAMLYLLLVGRAPYEPATGRIEPLVVLGLVQHGPPTPVLDLAPEADLDLVAICDKAMARALDDRYAGMEELADDLEAWLERRPTRASAPSVRHALRLFAERHKAAVATAAAGLCALVATGAVFFVRVTKERNEKEAARVDAQRRGDQLAANALIERESTELWPAMPDRVAVMDAWLREVDALVAREASYRAGATESGSASENEAVLAGIAELKLLRPRIAARREAAHTLRARTVDAHTAAWTETIDEIRSSPAYSGLSITPQLGLVPWRKNVESGLWEFWLDGSGERPSDDARVAEHQAIVLVLIPGGTFTMGRQEGESGKKEIESPRPVDVEPFFLAKYELTQAQWILAMGANPSRHVAGVHEGPPATLANPVDTVSWQDSDLFARRMGLRLPTMAEWEYAARAGSVSAFVYGDAPAALETYENVLDRSVTGNPPSENDWTDGYVWTAGVGSFRPNAFGLHDLLGNVAEWCSDRFSAVGPVAIGIPEHGTRAFRGGSWFQPPPRCRPSMIQWNGPAEANYANGLRVARSVTSE